MRAATALPELPGIGAPVPTTRYLLACLDGQRRLRVVRGNAEMERWVRAYARRWFVVEALSGDDARRAVAKYLGACATHVSTPIGAAQFGIVEAGRNGPGGPRALPRALGGVPVRDPEPTRPRRPARDREVVRPSPAVHERRRGRFRQLAARGKSLI